MIIEEIRRDESCWTVFGRLEQRNFLGVCDWDALYIWSEWSNTHKNQFCRLSNNFWQLNKKKMAEKGWWLGLVTSRGGLGPLRTWNIQTEKSQIIWNPLGGALKRRVQSASSKVPKMARASPFSAVSGRSLPYVSFLVSLPIIQSRSELCR